MKKTVALLDVDHTLKFGNETNLKLLAALKEKGIKDIYLFTDMTYSESALSDREKLKKELTDAGFTVHGVITPQDLTQGLPMHEAKQIFNQPGLKLFGEGFKQYIEANKNELPVAHGFMQEVAYAKHAASCIPGKAYEDACKADKAYKDACNSDTAFNNDLYIQSAIAKAIADYQAQQLGYPHTKGLLYDLFLRHNKEFTSVVVADDNTDVAKAIREFKPVEASTPVLPSVMIHVKSEHMTQANYEFQLDKMPKSPPIPKRKDSPNSAKTSDFRTELAEMRSSIEPQSPKIGSHRN